VIVIAGIYLIYWNSEDIHLHADHVKIVSFIHFTTLSVPSTIANTPQTKLFSTEGTFSHSPYNAHSTATHFCPAFPYWRRK
jgi:hypothetical protein